MIRRFLAATALVAVCSLPAHAEGPVPEPAPAGTAEGAAALRKALGAYLTDAPFETGILRVEPDPAGQRVTLDPAAMLSSLAGSTVQFAPLSFLVSERSNGDWNVFSRDAIAVAVETAIDGQVQTFEYRDGSQIFKGIFSPALAAFSQGEGVARDTVNIQNDAVSDSSATISQTTVSLSARANGGGGVDFDVRQTLKDYEQTLKMRMPPSVEQAPGGTPGEPQSGDDAAAMAAIAAMMNFSVGADELETTASVKGARTVETRDLYALLLRHLDDLSNDPQAALAGPLGVELRTALGKVLPLWLSFDADVTARDASLVSQFGGLKVAEARQAMRFSGVDENAGFDFDVAARGIEADAAVLPPWAHGLVPQEFEIGVAVSGVDLKTPAELALADLDFSKDPPLPPETVARIEGSFDPTRIAVRLKPSRVRSTDLDLRMNGEFSFAEAQPAGTVTMEAVGLDKAIATLQAAAQEQPDLHQAVGMLQVAKGFGRPKGDEAMEWIIETAADGSVSVNGTMLKGPDPVGEPLPEAGGPSEGAGEDSDL